MSILRRKISTEDCLFIDKEFIKAIKISTETLFDDLMKQPSVYWRYGKVVAHAQKVANDAESRVQFLIQQSKITLAEEKMISKPTAGTDKAAESLALTSKNYRTALDEVEQAKEECSVALYEAGLMQFAERCMRQRADLLKSLAFLEAGGLRVEGGNEIYRRTRDSVLDLEREAKKVFGTINKHGGEK